MTFSVVARKEPGSSASPPPLPCQLSGLLSHAAAGIEAVATQAQIDPYLEIDGLGGNSVLAIAGSLA